MQGEPTQSSTAATTAGREEAQVYPGETNVSVLVGNAGGLNASGSAGASNSLANESAPATEELAHREGLPPRAGSQVDPVALEQQLQLIQLCFYEHEFGVVLEDDDDGADDGASTQDRTAIGDAGHLLEFDPLAFIDGKVSHGVELEDLCKDLAFYMDFIKNKITHHVNTDMHTAFVDVSSRLFGMEDELQYVERPLGGSIKKVAVACEQLVTAAETVNSKVEHATDVEEERMFDVNFLRGLLLYEKITDIFDETAPLVSSAVASSSSWSTRTGEYNKRSNHPVGAAEAEAASLTCGTVIDKLSTLVMSVQPLKTLVAVLPELPQRANERAELASFVQEGEAAILGLLRRLFAHLCQIFFQYPEATGIAHALRRITLIYAKAGARVQFCQMFREYVLAPFLERIFPWKAVTQARQSTEETIRLLGVLQTELQNSVITLFPLLRRCFAGEPLCPASTILWPVLCELLVTRLVTLYEAGIADAFQRKYCAAYKLLALAESCCVSAEELTALRRSSDVTVWNFKWNTVVYAAMRRAEVIKAIEPSLAALRARKPLADLRASTPPHAAQTKDSANLIVFQQLQQQMTRLFSQDVFLLVCTPEFLRFSVMTCQNVLREALDYTHAALQRDGAAKEQLLPFLSVLLADVDGLGSFVQDTLSAEVQLTLAKAGLSSAEEKILPVVREVFAFVKDSLCKVCVAQAQELMTSSVRDECFAALQNVRTVRSAYSHTKKPLPSAASWYVANVVDPVVRFATVARQSGIDGAGLRRMLQTVVDVVAEHFASLAKETLITAKKTEDSWEKLRRRKEAADGGPSSPTMANAPSGARPTAESASDRDKMVLQLYLDARAFESAVESAVESTAPGAKGQRSPAMSALFALLQRAEWIQGADIPEPPEIEEE